MTLLDAWKNLNEFNNDDVLKLETLYKNTGCCQMNGYLGDSSINYDLDDCGRLQYNSKIKDNSGDIISTGCVLSDSVLIKQKQQFNNYSINQLFCWDILKNVYTSIVFDSDIAMNETFEKVKSLDLNLCDGDISALLKSIHVSFDDVAHVLTNQEYSSIDSMFDDTVELLTDDSLCKTF